MKIKFIKATGVLRIENKLCEEGKTYEVDEASGKALVGSGSFEPVSAYKHGKFTPPKMTKSLKKIIISPQGEEGKEK